MLLRLLVVFFCISTVVHADPVEQIPGESQKEREIRWAWKYLGSFVKACLQTNKDCQKTEIKAVLEKILPRLSVASMPTARARQLQFVPEQLYPKLFQSSKHEIHRLAVTEMKQGALIYINTNALDQPLSKWIGILVHEATHQLGYDDDERRVPDLVGSAVAAFTANNLIETNLAEFGHPKDGLIIFNDPSLSAPARILANVLHISVDQNATPNERVALCENDEVFAGQTISTPLWRVLHMRPDRGFVKIKGAGRLTSYCKSKNGSAVKARLAAFSIFIDLKFNAPMDLTTAWWDAASTIDLSTISCGSDDRSVIWMDLNRTYTIVSMTHDSPKLIPAQDLNTRIIVESTDGHIPQKCEIYFTAVSWPFQRLESIPTFIDPNTIGCSLRDLGQNKWELTTSFAFPANTQPDLFYIPFLRFVDAKSSERYASFAKPKFIALENPKVQPRLTISGWRAVDVVPLRLQTEKGESFKNSYVIKTDQAFWLEVDVKGTQQVADATIEIDLFDKYDNYDVILRPFVLRLDEKSVMLLDKEHISIPGGTRLRYKIMVPSSDQNRHRFYGFKLQQFYAQTDDFAWIELFLPDFKEAMFMAHGALQ